MEPTPYRMKTIRRRIRLRRKVNWQTGKTIIPIDIKRSALGPGWRRSKRGKEYFEARRNRSDQNPDKKL